MKDSGAIVFAILASALIWLLSSLSAQTTDIVSVPVTVSSNLPGHTLSASGQVEVSAAVQTSGYKLLSLHSQGKPSHITVDKEYLHPSGGEYFYMSESDLFRYASDIFGAGVKVQSFVTKNLNLRFPVESYRKVAVLPVQNINCNSQYMPMGHLSVSPDSVLVYGEPSRLENVDQVLTKVISHSGVKRNVSGVVKLDAPAGTRLADNVVSYSLDVTRFVETRSTVTVSVRNLPQDMELTVFPSKVEVYARYVFPITDKTSTFPEIYVDYNDFIRSQSGKCIVKSDSYPSGLIELRMEPVLVDCVLTK